MNDWLLVESLLTVVVTVGSLVVLHLMVSVGGLVMSVVWLVVHLVRAVGTVLWMAVSVMLISIISVMSFDFVVSFDSVVCFNSMVSFSFVVSFDSVVAISVWGTKVSIGVSVMVTIVSIVGLVVIMETSITVVWLTAIL